MSEKQGSTLTRQAVAHLGEGAGAQVHDDIPVFAGGVLVPVTPLLHAQRARERAAADTHGRASARGHACRCTLHAGVGFVLKLQAGALLLYEHIMINRAAQPYPLEPC